MNASKLVFRGNITGPGEWYGKTEKQDGEKTLVLFKRPRGQGSLQSISDKINGIRKGPELAQKFILGKKIELVGDLIGMSILQRHLSSTKHHDETLSAMARDLAALPIHEDGSAKLDTLVEMTKGPEKGQIKNMIISWQPNEKP